MTSFEEIKTIISNSKNVCLIPSEDHEGESVLNALALFYTLKESGKNVNLIFDDFPEKFNFLIPSIDYISSPKNFVISVPEVAADVSSVYYEKNNEGLKIHLTVEKGIVKKENISFYFSQAKPDATITLGIKDLKSYLPNKLDSFGFVLDSPIFNIDQPEAIWEIVKIIGDNKNAATCVLAALMLHYDNFQNTNSTPEVFELCAQLMKKGADRQSIIKNLFNHKNSRPTLLTEQEIINAVHGPLI